MFCIGKLDKEKINKIFNYLYEIYQVTKSSNKSILSDEIILFKKAFENLCCSLKGENIGLDKFDDLKKLSEKIINEEKPSPKSFSFPNGELWLGTNKTSTRDDFKSDEEKVIRVTMDEETDNQDSRKEDKIEVENKTKKKEDLEIIKNKIEFGKIGGKELDLFRNEESEDEEDNEFRELEKIHLKKTDVIVKLKK